MISQVCESFGCTPAEALEQPTTLTLEIMWLRAFRAAKQEVENATEGNPASRRSQRWYGEVVEYLLELQERGNRR